MGFSGLANKPPLTAWSGLCPACALKDGLTSCPAPGRLPLTWPASSALLHPGFPGVQCLLCLPLALAGNFQARHGVLCSHGVGAAEWKWARFLCPCLLLQTVGAKERLLVPGVRPCARVHMCACTCACMREHLVPAVCVVLSCECGPPVVSREVIARADVARGMDPTLRTMASCAGAEALELWEAGAASCFLGPLPGAPFWEQHRDPSGQCRHQWGPTRPTLCVLPAGT